MAGKKGMKRTPSLTEKLLSEINAANKTQKEKRGPGRPAKVKRVPIAQLVEQYVQNNADADVVSNWKESVKKAATARLEAREALERARTLEKEIRHLARIAG